MPIPLPLLSPRPTASHLPPLTSVGRRTHISVHLYLHLPTEVHQCFPKCCIIPKVISVCLLVLQSQTSPSGYYQELNPDGATVQLCLTELLNAHAKEAELRLSCKKSRCDQLWHSSGETQPSAKDEMPL